MSLLSSILVCNNYCLTRLLIRYRRKVLHLGLFLYTLSEKEPIAYINALENRKIITLNDTTNKVLYTFPSNL